MRLFEINQTLRQVLEMGFSVNEETGELLFDESNLHELEMAREEKLLGLAKVIKEKNAFLKALKEEKQSIDQRIKTLSNEVERLTTYALSNMNEGDKLEDSQAKISWSKGSESVQILGDVPNEFLRIKTTEEPDKTKIKDILKMGINLGFAEMVRTPKVLIK